ncbi:peptidase family C78-domain-containing protein [Amylocystis lapponica]|nr:peptidase family C78-domain-containing protein [Amylocystis lapponica]
MTCEYIDVDDDIQILYEESLEPQTMLCEFCGRNLTKCSVQLRQEHYEEHLSGQSIGSSGSSSKPTSSSKPVSKSSRSKGKSQEPSSGENVFWYSSQATPPPPNFSPGLIPILKRALIKSHEKDHTQRAWLCHEQAVHINTDFDRGWGCGYRNFLMACAVLMAQSQQPMYFPLLDAPTSPGIRNLQACIEEAWDKGYDKDGANDLNHHLVGTRKWIGTAELHVAFTSRGIPSQLVDFELKDGVHVLVDWVLRYFSEEDGKPKDTTVNQALRAARPVIVTGKMPLILQHAGHSRTVIGCEREKNGHVNFLMFDPSRAVPSSIRKAGLTAHGLADRGESSSKHSFMKTYQSLKRKANNTSANSSTKRVRATTNESQSNNDPIEIDSDDEGIVEVKPANDDPEPGTVLRCFRVAETALKKHKKYQILYFPLGPPWEESERWQRREVLSIRVK